MTNSFSTHLIDFYDLPQHVPGDRTPRILGRLSNAGANLIAAVPLGVHRYHIDQQHDFAFTHRQTPRGERAGDLVESGLRNIGCAISRRMAAAQPLQQRWPIIFDLHQRYVPKEQSAKAPFWHRDGLPHDPYTRQVIIGGPQRAYNTQYATIPVPTTLLAFGVFTPADARDKAVSAFLGNANAIAQIGENEVVELFGETPHRSSPHYRENSGLWTFPRFDFG